MIKVTDKVKVTSFMLESDTNPEGIDYGEVVHIDSCLFSPVCVRLNRGDADGHKHMRFNYDEVVKEENNQ